MRSFFCALSVLILTACGPNQNAIEKGEKRIPDDQFIQILVDIHIADAAAKLNVIPTNNTLIEKQQLYKGVLSKHQYTFEDFQETLTFYSYHSKEYKELYERVINNISEQLANYPE